MDTQHLHSHLGMSGASLLSISSGASGHSWQHEYVVSYHVFPPDLGISLYWIDYTSAVMAGMAVFIFANWILHGKKHYQGPKVDCLSAIDSTALLVSGED